MPQIVVRQLSDEVHRALKARAQEHGRSTEAEVREIIARAVLPETRQGRGSARGIGKGRMSPGHSSGTDRA